MYAHPLLTMETMRQSVPALLQRARGALAPAKVRCTKILVPLDGSATSEAALSHVLLLARAMPLSVHLLNVQPPVMAGDVTPFATAAMAEHHRRAAGEQALKRARSALAAARIAHTAQVVFGSPATAIVRCALINACTKIVMATRNVGFFRGLLRPSVARRVLRLARMPVTVVKATLAAHDVRHPRGVAPVDVRALCSWRKRSCATGAAYQVG